MTVTTYKMFVDGVDHPILKAFKTVTHTSCVEYKTLEQILISLYDIKNLNLIDSCKWENRSHHTYDAETCPETDPDLMAMLESPEWWLLENGSLAIYTFLGDMVNRGLCPEGKVVVRVSW